MVYIHDYKESTVALQLGEAIAENTLAGIQEMWSQGRKIIGKIRNDLLELKTCRDTRDYGYDEQNDISTEWLSVKKALINGEIPEFGKNQIKETTEEEEMKETVETTETKEIMETNEEEVKVDEVLDKEETPLTEETTEEEETTQEEEIPQEEETPQEEVDKDTLFNDNLDETHPITEDCKFAILCKRDGYRIEVQIVRNEANHTVQCCQIYAVNEETNRRLIDATGGVRVSREKIMNSENSDCMKFMRKFDINFKNDDLTKAYDRLKSFIETSKVRVDTGDMDVMDAFDQLQSLVKERAEAEEKNPSIKERNYIYNEKDKCFQIRAAKFQQALDDADTGFKRRIFCMRLRMEENSTGRKYIENNRSAGYGFYSNNQSWFRFAVNTSV